MRLYRNAYTEKDGNEHQGYEFFVSKESARQAAKANDECDTDTTVIEVLGTKAGIVDALNRFGGHPDNG
jgi:hypothetical protein